MSLTSISPDLSVHCGQREGLTNAYAAFSLHDVYHSDTNDDPDLVLQEGGKCHAITQWALRGYESTIKPWSVRESMDGEDLMHFEPVSLNLQGRLVETLSVHDRGVAPSFGAVNLGELYEDIVDPGIPFVEGYRHLGDDTLYRNYQPGSLATFVFTMQDPERFFGLMESMYDRSDRKGSVKQMAEVATL